MNPVSARLLNQQLNCPQLTSPHDVVEWMGAMQAQEYRMMRWAVGMRTKKPSAKTKASPWTSIGSPTTSVWPSIRDCYAAETFSR